jgi:hypothetical protein
LGGSSWYVSKSRSNGSCSGHLLYLVHMFRIECDNSISIKRTWGPECCNTYAIMHFVMNTWNWTTFNPQSLGHFHGSMFHPGSHQLGTPKQKTSVIPLLTIRISVYGCPAFGKGRVFRTAATRITLRAPLPRPPLDSGSSQSVSGMRHPF